MQSNEFKVIDTNGNGIGGNGFENDCTFNEEDFEKIINSISKQ